MHALFLESLVNVFYGNREGNLLLQAKGVVTMLRAQETGGNFVPVFCNTKSVCAEVVH